MNYSTKDIESILSSLGAQRCGAGEGSVRWLLTDSRSLSSPEDTVFFALVTNKGDGHRYLEPLYQRGVRTFVVQRLPEPAHDDAIYFLVSDSLAALQCIAAHHRSQFRIPVIGVTGSNGKTTVKEWLFQMLSPDHVVTRSPRSYNSQVGVPLSVWNLSADTELGIFEAAISQPSEMEALERIIRPTIGVFTCLGDAHQENFASLEQKCSEKLRLFRDAQVIVYAEGNPVVDACVRSIDFKGQLLPVQIPQDASAVDVNRLLCRAVCLHLGLPESEVDHRLSALAPVSMRLEVKEGVRGCTIINDSYNSDLASLDIALDFMQRRPNESLRGHTLILSDMEQTGLEDETLYSRVADMVRSRGITTFVGVGQGISHCASLFQTSAQIDENYCRNSRKRPQVFANSSARVSQNFQTFFFPSTEALLESNLFASLTDQVILIKGARSFHFEHLVDRLEQRLHETILEVDLGAIVANLNYYRSLLKPTTRIVCMVKAGAYGAGSTEVARILEDHRVDYLAVAVADEGVELRRAGISTGIMVMNPELSCLTTLFHHSLEPEVYSFRLLDALIAAAEREGITGFPVHIKLDTGMHRLGFNPTKDLPRLIYRLQHQQALLPRSVFSHFVGSDSDNFNAFSARQYELFIQAADALQSAYPHHRILRHICNSTGIEHFPDRHCDMVRLGLGLYGVNGLTNTIINNVSTLKTTILQIRDVPAGDTVGYSRKGKVTRPSRIAALPIGYADGLNRHLGNGNAYCLINGKPAPYIGNICMDVTLVDVTDVPCHEGDTAIIFGRQLPVTLLASVLGTIPYEILTSVSSRVPRVYYHP